MPRHERDLAEARARALKNIRLKATGKARENKDNSALEEARRQAEGVGVDPDRIDPRYVEAIARGDTGSYFREASGRRGGGGRNIVDERRRQTLRDLPIPDFSARRKAIEAQARPQRRVIDIQSIQAAERLRGILAESGILRGGGGVTAQVALAGQRQQALADIGVGQLQAYAALEAEQARQIQERALLRAQLQAQTVARQEGFEFQEAQAARQFQQQQQLIAEQRAYDQPARDLQLQQYEQALRRGEIELEALPRQIQVDLALKDLQLKYGYGAARGLTGRGGATRVAPQQEIQPQVPKAKQPVTAQRLEGLSVDQVNEIKLEIPDYTATLADVQNTITRANEEGLGVVETKSLVINLLEAGYNQGIYSSSAVNLVLEDLEKYIQKYLQSQYRLR